MFSFIYDPYELFILFGSGWVLGDVGFVMTHLRHSLCTLSLLCFGSVRVMASTSH